MSAVQPRPGPEALFEQVRAEFARTLLERLMEVEEILAWGALNGLGPEALVAIRHHAHKTAGVAGTLGMNRIGLHAASVDRMLSKIIARSPDAPEISTALEAIDRMQSAIEAQLAP